MKTGKIFWGLLFILGGIALLLTALGIGQEFNAGRIIISILLVSLGIASFIRFRFFLSLVPLAVVVYLWQDQLGLQNLDTKLLFLSAVVLSIGMSIVFRRKNYHVKHHHNWSETKEVIDNDEQVVIDSSFGEQTKYVHATNLKKVNIAGNFATVKVFFDQCELSPEGVDFEVSANFCEVNLTVPRTWKLVNNVNAFAASIKEHNDFPMEGRRIIHLNGSANFAEVKIIYI